MKTHELKQMLDFPENLKSPRLYNRVISLFFPGGGEILDILERLHQAQHGRLEKGMRPDPLFQELLDKAKSARDQMIEAIKACGEDGVLVRIVKD